MGRDKKLSVSGEVFRVSFGGTRSPHIQAQMWSLLRAGTVPHSSFCPLPGHRIGPHQKQVSYQSSLVDSRPTPSLREAPFPPTRLRFGEDLKGSPGGKEVPWETGDWVPGKEPLLPCSVTWDKPHALWASLPI